MAEKPSGHLVFRLRRNDILQLLVLVQGTPGEVPSPTVWIGNISLW